MRSTPPCWPAWALLTPPLRPINSKIIDEMKELHIARLALVKDGTAAKNREHACRSPLLKRHTAQRLAQIYRQIEAIDAALKACLESDPYLVARFKIIVSIPGVGTLTAVTMLIEMPESASSTTSRSPASPAWRHKPTIADSTGASATSAVGRAILRKALYMPALVAARYNADMKVKYQAMIAAGKPAKVAITTCENSSSSQTRSSEPTVHGPKRSLDHNGYSNFDIVSRPMVIRRGDSFTGTVRTVASEYRTSRRPTA